MRDRERKMQKRTKNIRRQLRREMTNAEKLFWYKIKNHFFDVKFRRQHSIGSYIVDFYCSELKLVIEVDGNVHYYDENIKNDNIRQKYLESLGLKVIRYTNLDVLYNLDNTLMDLENIIQEINPHPNPLPEIRERE